MKKIYLYLKAALIISFIIYILTVLIFVYFRIRFLEDNSYLFSYFWALCISLIIAYHGMGFIRRIGNRKTKMIFKIFIAMLFILILFAFPKFHNTNSYSDCGAASTWDCGGFCAGFVYSYNDTAYLDLSKESGAVHVNGTQHSYFYKGSLYRNGVCIKEKYGTKCIGLEIIGSCVGY